VVEGDVFWPNYRINNKFSMFITKNMVRKKLIVGIIENLNLGLDICKGIAKNCYFSIMEMCTTMNMNLVHRHMELDLVRKCARNFLGKMAMMGTTSSIRQISQL
jgi:hypothetical protein